MTQWDLTPGEALDQLRQWQTTTTVMQWRIMDPAAGAHTRQGDMFLFAMAARQALRFARLVREVAPPELHSDVQRAINEFDQTAPDIKGIRDVLDHLDEYLRGVGRDYPAGPPRSHDNEFIGILRPSFMWTERTDATCRLVIVPAPGHRLVLDVTRDAAAVRQLGDAIGVALNM